MDPAMPQQEALQMLARLAEHPHGRGSGPNQIAHRLVRRVRHQTAVSSPARCSFARLSASRRSVFTRSPGLLGIKNGATTMQA